MINSETASFYKRFNLYTIVAPSFATAVCSITIAYVSLTMSGGRMDNWLSWVGIPLIVACVGGFEIFSRAGFAAFGINRKIVRRKDEDREVLRELVDPEEEKEMRMAVSLLDIGPVPYLSVGGYTRNQLWVSRHTLLNTGLADLKQLMAHERAHLEQSAWLDRLLITGVYWWIVSVTAAQLVTEIHWLVVIAAVSAAIYIRILRAINDRQQQRADMLAMGRSDGRAYAAAIARHVSEFDASEEKHIVQKRLSRMGLKEGEVSKLIASEI